MSTVTQAARGKIVPVLPEIKLPGAVDLAALYAAADAYSEAGLIAFNAWYAIKEAHGHEAAYADQDYKPLHAAEDEAAGRLKVEADTIGRRYSWLDRLSAHGHASRGGGSARVRRSIRWNNRDHVDHEWKTANKEIVTPLFKALERPMPATAPEVGSAYFSKTIGDIFEVVKVTHKGNRIEIQSVFTGDTRTIRPADFSGSRPASTRSVATAKRLHASRHANLERFGAEVIVED